MRTYWLVVWVVAAAWACGCEQAQPTQADDICLVKAYADEQMVKAILVQQSIYPYHFEGSSCKLNALGRHDLAILAEAYRPGGGALTLVRGQASPELYRDRGAEVAKALEELGVKASKVTIREGLPGGDGMHSAQVRAAHEKKQDQSGKGYYVETGSTADVPSAVVENNP